jgi:hypothetical protein
MTDEAVRRLFVAAVSDLSGEPTAVNVARYLRASAALERSAPAPRRVRSSKRDRGRATTGTVAVEPR